MYFVVVADDGEPGEEYALDWHDDPVEFARNLRACADWLEAHSSENINASVD